MRDLWRIGINSRKAIRTMPCWVIVNKRNEWNAKISLNLTLCLKSAAIIIAYFLDCLWSRDRQRLLSFMELEIDNNMRIVWNSLAVWLIIFLIADRLFQIFHHVRRQFVHFFWIQNLIEVFERNVSSSSLCRFCLALVWLPAWGRTGKDNVEWKPVVKR